MRYYATIDFSTLYIHMKKLLAILALTLSFATSAQTVVPIAWGFNPASSSASALRTLIDNANKNQTKYQFIFEPKAGAGGAIAANYVIKSEKLTLMMISSSVFTRPIFFPEASYDIDDLVPVAIVSTGAPQTIISKNYKTLEELQAANGSLAVGLGSMAEAVGRKVQGVRPIPYKATPEGTKDALGGHVDAAIEFMTDSKTFVDSGMMYPLAITGRKAIKPFTKILPGTENFVMNYHVLANKSVSQETLKELNEIFVKANSEPNIKEIWDREHATTEQMDLVKSTLFWETQKKFWKSFK